MKRLSERQKRLVEYYCGECEGNVYRAAQMAGYSEQYARGRAYAVLRLPLVQEYIKELTEETRSKNVATVAEIKAFWSMVMNDPTARMSDRLKASEYLAKCEGEFTRNNW
ncbi:terminase small subunit [Clostridiales Family XIII bacterium ASD5510]|uniref:Terminase small subunit n=1 Tax=Hominibacterium faecale TaxID=2839743 RepID=A0A9J6QWG5_9FIRM|nr:terminase small subunit [Hominibacterium faecale]MCU7379726.1 terminase small subunit [Hominibacterium faecale]